MRTITKKMSDRLKVQAKEAEVVGLTKLASHLNRLTNNNVRDNNASYIYSDVEFKTDMEGLMWDAVVRAADYYNCNISSEELQEDIEKMANHLARMVALKAGINHNVGAFEPIVFGEVTENVELEVE